MATNLVRVKFKPEKLKEILEGLGNNTESYEITLSLGENYKEALKFLATSGDVLDWEFTEELNTPEIPENPKIEKNLYSYSPDDPKQLTKLATEHLGVFSTNEVATLVEAVWVQAKQHPEISYGGAQWMSSLVKTYKDVGNQEITIDHALLKMIIEAAYAKPDNTWDIPVIVESCFTKFKEMGNKIQNIKSTSELARILFGKFPGKA